MTRVTEVSSTLSAQPRPLTSLLGAKADGSGNSGFLQKLGLRRWVLFAGVLDYYGQPHYVRSGRVLVPEERGGASLEGFGGSRPRIPRQIYYPVSCEDEGWLAAYFDAFIQRSS